MSDELAVAIDAALAGCAALRGGSAGRIEAKEDRTSIVTDADRASQAAVVTVLRAAFPADAVLGEEGTVGDATASRAWIVDPLDGTTNYAHGLPFSCVSVALREGASVVVAAVADPWRGEVFAARRGGGATLDGAPVGVSGTASLGAALVATQLQSDDANAIAAHAARVGALHRAARGVRSPGSPALCLAYLACGRLDAFVEARLKPWDTAAGLLLVAEAGGRVSDFTGAAVPIDRPSDIAASNGTLHAELLGAIG